MEDSVRSSKTRSPAVDSFGYDSERWQNALRDANNKPIAEVRGVYDRFFDLYPKSDRYWKQYIEQEMQADAGEVDKAEIVGLLFNKCLESCWSVEIWMLWLKHLRQRNASREEFLSQLERAISLMGRDIHAAPLWKEYISHLSTVEVSYGNRFEEGAKVTGLRRAFQRAVIVPMEGVEQIWAEYELFENELNKSLAKGVLSDMGPRFQAARSTLRERKALFDRLQEHVLAVPFQGTDREIAQLTAWKRLISWEMDNPQKLDAKEHQQVVILSYRVALCALYHYPGMWYEAASRAIEFGNESAAQAFFEEGIGALPRCVPLQLAFSGFLEGKGDADGAQEVFESLLRGRLPKQKEEDGEQILAGDANELTLIFIHYLYLVRRTRGIDAARELLIRAKNVERINYHFFVAASEMEYMLNANASFAQKILKYGMKRYPRSVAFVLRYASFLRGVNNQKELRVLFEKAVDAMPHERELWNKFLEFEYQCGSADSVCKLESRRAAQFGSMDPSGFSTLFYRYAYDDLFPCSDEDFAPFADAFPDLPATMEGGSAEEEQASAVSSLRKYRAPSLRVVAHPELSRWRLIHPEPPPLRIDADENEDELLQVKLEFEIPRAIRELVDTLPRPFSLAGVPSLNANAVLKMLKGIDVPLPESAEEEGRNVRGEVSVERDGAENEFSLQSVENEELADLKRKRDVEPMSEEAKAVVRGVDIFSRRKRTKR